MATPTGSGSTGEEEFHHLNSATTSDNATIHGIVQCVSPMKRGKSTNYFEGKLSDGNAHMRLVGFQDSLRKRLSSFQSEAAPVSLTHCKIKRARDSDDLEVMLNAGTRLTKSPKKFHLPSTPPVQDTDTTIVLKDVPDLTTYSKVTFTAKVISVSKPEKISNGLTKQEVIVSDSTGPARLTLWEADIDSLQEFQSYVFRDMNVRSFKNEKYLTKPRDTASIEQTDDIGEVADDDLPTDSTTLSGVEVIGVQSLQSYSACVACNAKVDIVDESMGSCTKCEMFQPIRKTKQKLSARLYLQHGENYLTLSAFDDILNTIAQSDDITPSTLLNASPFTLTYVNNIIVSVDID